jgi:hypothetical protein
MKYEGGQDVQGKWIFNFVKKFSLWTARFHIILLSTLTLLLEKTGQGIDLGD